MIREHRVALLAALLAAAAGAAIEYRLNRPEVPPPPATAQPPATLPEIELQALDGRAVRLPQAWAGLTDAALEQASGVPGARFCHNGRFIAVAATREAVLEMARIAVSEAEAQGI